MIAYTTLRLNGVSVDDATLFYLNGTTIRDFNNPGKGLLTYDGDLVRTIFDFELVDQSLALNCSVAMNGFGALTCTAQYGASVFQTSNVGDPYAILIDRSVFSVPKYGVYNTRLTLVAIPHC